MDDPDIETLRAGWHDAGGETELRLRAIRRRRWLPVIVTGAEVGAATVTALLGAWLIWHGLRAHIAAYSTLGAPLFACGFSLSIVLADARRASLTWRDETPGDLLRTGLRQVEASLRVIDIMRWYAVGILLFLIATRIVNLVKGEAHGPYTWLATGGGVTICGLYWLWLTGRRRKSRIEQRILARLLAEEQTA